MGKKTQEELAAENDSLRSLLKGLILSLQSQIENAELVLRRVTEAFDALENEDE